MENFQINLVQIGGHQKFANTDYQAEEYIVNYFTNYVNSLKLTPQTLQTPQTSEDKLRDGIFYDLNDVHENVKEGWIVVRKGGNDYEMKLYKINCQQKNGWFSSDQKRSFDLEKTATIKVIDNVDSPYVQLITDECRDLEKTEMINIVKDYLNQVENTSGRENKRKKAKELFDVLKTDKGKRFIYNHSKFKETVRHKLLEFILVEKVEEFVEDYEQIFGYLFFLKR